MKLTLTKCSWEVLPLLGVCSHCLSISFLHLNLFLHDMTGANGTELVIDVIWMVLYIIFIFCIRKFWLAGISKIVFSETTRGMELLHSTSRNTTYMNIIQVCVLSFLLIGNTRCDFFQWKRSWVWPLLIHTKYFKMTYVSFLISTIIEGART